jgi:hypothetical protein
MPPATASRIVWRFARAAGPAGVVGIGAWQRGQRTYPSGTATAHLGHGVVVAGSGLTPRSYMSPV